MDSSIVLIWPCDRYWKRSPLIVDRCIFRVYRRSLRVRCPLPHACNQFPCQRSMTSQRANERKKKNPFIVSDVAFHLSTFSHYLSTSLSVDVQISLSWLFFGGTAGPLALAFQFFIHSKKRDDDVCSWAEERGKSQQWNYERDSPERSRRCAPLSAIEEALIFWRGPSCCLRFFPLSPAARVNVCPENFPRDGNKKEEKWGRHGYRQAYSSRLQGIFLFFPRQLSQLYSRNVSRERVWL